MVALRPETLGCSRLPASRSLSGRPLLSLRILSRGLGGPWLKGTLYLIWSLTGCFQTRLKAGNQPTDRETRARESHRPRGRQRRLAWPRPTTAPAPLRTAADSRRARGETAVSRPFCGERAPGDTCVAASGTWADLRFGFCIAPLNSRSASSAPRRREPDTAGPWATRATPGQAAGAGSPVLCPARPCVESTPPPRRPHAGTAAAAPRGLGSARVEPRVLSPSSA